jgi:hypothetical protein
VLAILAIAVVAAVGALWGSQLLARNSADAAHEARRERIAAMSAAEKEQLKVKQERFAKLDDAERKKLRTLHAAIENHPQHEELTRVMMRYRQWLRELTPEDRASLLTTELSGRLAVAQMLQEKLHQRYLAEAGKEMSEAEARVVKDWMDALVAERIPAALEVANGGQKRMLERAIEKKETHFQRGIVWDMIFRGSLPAITAEDHLRLAAAVSTERRETFQRAKTKEERERVVNAWIMGATFYRRGFGGPGPSHEDLEQELAKLPPEERKRVSTLPPEQMRDALRRKWFETRFSNRGGRGGPGDRGPGDRGPGDRDGPPRPPFDADRQDRDGERDNDGRRGDRRDGGRRDDDRDSGRGGRRDRRDDDDKDRESEQAITRPTTAPSAPEP